MVVNARKRRFQCQIEMEVIASDKRDIFGNAQARLQHYLDRGKGNWIVIAKDAVRTLCLQ